jgi:hypothetical protein
MEFRTSSYRHGLIGLAVAGAVLVAIGVLVDQLTQRPFSPLALGLGVATLLLLFSLAVVLYWTVATLRLRYRLDRNGLRIYWGASELVVPIGDIQTIAPLSQLKDNLGLRSGFAVRGWLGGLAGRVRLGDGRVAVLRSTDTLNSSMAVLTSTTAYLVSPDRPDAFLRAWRERRPLGPTQAWHEEERFALPLVHPIWNDRVTWGLMGGMLMSALVMYGTMALVYERLPDTLALHFDVFGQPDRIGQRSDVLRLPVVALLVLLIDLTIGFVVYRRDRVAAYLIWAGGILLQMLAWGALYTIANR